MTDYRSPGQQALLQVIDVLAERPLAPLSLADIDTRLEGVSRDRIYRALKNLELAGWAEQAGGAWRLTPHLTRASERLRIALADLHHRYLDVR